MLYLHGYPETWYAWRKQWPDLARDYHVVMPDLRGYGDTDKPDIGYDKRTMAEDIREVAAHLGYEATIVALGSRRASPKITGGMVDRLAVLDNIPTRLVFSATDAKLAKLYWFFYVQQVPHLPEALIQGREEIFLRHFYSAWCYNPGAIDEAAVAEYVRAYSQPGALRGAFNDYRAGPVDLKQDIEDQDNLIDCPVLAIWGSDFELVGKAFDVWEVWRGLARNVRGVAISECGHLPQEEQPERVNQELREFLRGWGG